MIVWTPREECLPRNGEAFRALRQALALPGHCWDDEDEVYPTCPCRDETDYDEDDRTEIREGHGCTEQDAANCRPWRVTLWEEVVVEKVEWPEKSEERV